MKNIIIFYELFKMPLKKILEKTINLYNKTFEYAKEIGFYNKKEYLIKNKHDILMDFLNEYKLNEFLKYKTDDMLILHKPRKKEYLFITNNDELTFLMPNTSLKSCMSFRGVYFLMLFFEKIVFANTYFTIFTIKKDEINFKNEFDLIIKDKFYLLKKFYNSKGDNKRINVIYFKDYVSLFLELYSLKNNINSRMINNFINFFVKNKNKIINYFIDKKILNYTPDVFYLLDKSKYSYLGGYNHKIKIGILISENLKEYLINNFKEYLNKEFLDGKMVLNPIKKIKYYNDSMQFINKFLDLEKKYQINRNLIEEIIKYISKDTEKCFICNENNRHDYSIMCLKCSEELKNVDIINNYNNQYYYNYEENEIL